MLLVCSLAAARSRFVACSLKVDSSCSMVSALLLVMLLVILCWDSQIRDLLVLSCVIAQGLLLGATYVDFCDQCQRPCGLLIKVFVSNSCPFCGVNYLGLFFMSNSK
jgi:hypothetical protein